MRSKPLRLVGTFLYHLSDIQIKAELDFPIDDADGQQAEVPEDLEKKGNERAMQHFQ